MGMMLKFLAPGMQDAEESDLSAETLGISGDLDQRFGAEAEQQSIHHFLVLQGQRRQFVWERENDVGVRRGQQPLQDILNRTYQIGLYYNNPNSRYVAGIGRFLLPWAPSLSTIRSEERRVGKEG